MVDASGEVHFRGFKRIVGGEVDGQKEDASLEGAVTLLTPACQHCFLFRSQEVEGESCRRRM